MLAAAIVARGVRVRHVLDAGHVAARRPRRGDRARLRATAFALINLAWAPGAARSALGGLRRAPSPTRGLRRRPYLRRARVARLRLRATGDPEASRCQPRRDRAPRLSRVPRARHRDGRSRAAGRQRRAARPFRRRDGRDHLVPRVRGAHPRSQASRAPTRSTPATASWRRTPTSHAPWRRPGSSGSGPRPRHSRSRGDKLRSKQVAREAGVPVVESGEPAELGFPLILKAAAGGGGRGMRVVRSADELEEAEAAASREAQAAFGDGTVFAERYVERPRHVEIQLLGDVHGDGRVARRARVLDPATPPEGARGSAVARARPRAPRADRRGGCCVRAKPSATAARAPPSSWCRAASSGSSS